MSFIYITHKLSEVFQIADRVMVMRDGKHVGTRAVSEVTENDLISMMVGRQITSLYGDAKKEQGEEYFRVQDFTQTGAFENVSLWIEARRNIGLFWLDWSGTE